MFLCSEYLLILLLYFMGEHMHFVNRYIRLIGLSLTALLVCHSSFAIDNTDASLSERLFIGSFSQGDLVHWETKEFNGNTEYKISTDVSGTKSLMANSNNNASGLFKEQRIDLLKTPYLNWSWKTNHLYSGLNEKTKSGDDFVARIYIVIDGGMFVWKTKALNYIWSSSFEENDYWPNPYIDNATMFVVESGEKNLGQWLSYKRNVSKDLKKVLGKNVRYIDAIAVMTDSDSSGQQALTYYGDIYFSKN